MQENTFEATISQYQYVADRLLEYDNVHLFYFQTMPEILDLNNYADYTHYKPDINRFMVECFKDGSYEIHSSEEMQNQLAIMRDMVATFDFDELLNKEW